MSVHGAILVVDDDETFRLRLARALSDRGYTVTTAANREEARAATAQSLAFAIIDLKLGRDSGLDVLADLRAQYPSLRAVVLSGYATTVEASEALRRGAVACVRKPADADQILAALMVPGA